MSKLTTLQVRAIMLAHGVSGYEMWTNKSKNHTGQDRRVKCYFRNNLSMLQALQSAAGGAAVKVTRGASWAQQRPALIVKCVLA